MMMIYSLKYSTRKFILDKAVQHPTKQQLYGHLPPITKTIKVRRTRHVRHCRRSRDELVRDIILWTPSHGRAKAWRPARTYTQQLCADTRCNPEDQPKEMDDRKGWWESFRDICADWATWWWRWWWWYEFLCSNVKIGFFAKYLYWWINIPKRFYRSRVSWMKNKILNSVFHTLWHLTWYFSVKANF